MKNLLIVIALLSCFPAMAQTGNIRPAPQSAIRKVNRDPELERAALARSGKLATVLQPEARAKLEAVAKALISRISAGSENIDLSAFTQREVRSKFPKLTGDQSLLLDFYVFAEALRFLSDNSNSQDINEMNEMSEMTSLRLQMTMDRRSKFISTLSQMMKKTSSTSDELVQNIK